MSNTITDKLWSVHISSDMCGVLSQKADFLHFPATKHSLDGVTLHLTWLCRPQYMGGVVFLGPEIWDSVTEVHISVWAPWPGCRRGTNGMWNWLLIKILLVVITPDSWELTPSYPRLTTLSPVSRVSPGTPRLWGLWIWQHVDHPEDNLKFCSLMHSLILCENREYTNVNYTIGVMERTKILRDLMM